MQHDNIKNALGEATMKAIEDVFRDAVASTIARPDPALAAAALRLYIVDMLAVSLVTLHRGPDAVEACHECSARLVAVVSAAIERK